MKKRLIMLMILSAFSLQEFAFGMQQDTTKKQKKHQRDTLKRDTAKKDTLKKIKP